MQEGRSFGSASSNDWVVLTHRQQGVLTHLARGATYREIAATLFVTTATVRSHVVELQRKFEVRNNVSLVLAAVAVGVLSAAAWPVEATGRLEFDPAQLRAVGDRSSITAAH